MQTASTLGRRAAVHPASGAAAKPVGRGSQTCSRRRRSARPAPKRASSAGGDAQVAPSPRVPASRQVTKLQPYGSKASDSYCPMLRCCACCDPLRLPAMSLPVLAPR